MSKRKLNKKTKRVKIKNKTRRRMSIIELSLVVNPPVLNSVDLGLTVLFTFFWLTAASSLAWAKGQIYGFTTPEV